MVVYDGVWMIVYDGVWMWVYNVRLLAVTGALFETPILDEDVGGILQGQQSWPVFSVKQILHVPPPRLPASVQGASARGGEREVGGVGDEDALLDARFVFFRLQWNRITLL